MKIDREKFYTAYDKFIRGEFTLGKASEYMGVSRPTTNKYFNMVYLGEPLPENLFARKNKEAEKPKKHTGR